MSQPARIVLIEDNPGDVYLLRQALAHQGEPYSLEVLADGEQALRFLTAHCRQESESEPCVIVLDLHLPKHDGLTILRALRKEPSLAQVRVAVLTSIASPHEAAEIRTLGVDLFREKPDDFEGFLSLAAALLALCHQQTHHAAVG